MTSALLLSLLLAVQEPSGTLPAFDPAKPVTASALADELDRSLHWLRQRFDTQKGTFGSLEADAEALLALAVSPRKYRPTEGPFMERPLQELLAAQKPDGSYAADVPGWTVLHALEAVKDERATAAAARLRPHLSGTDPAAAKSSTTAPDARAKQILAARRPDGSFGEGKAAVVETARRIAELSALHAEIEKQAPKKPARDAHPLPSFGAVERAEVDKTLQRGASYLLSQAKDSGWGFDGQKDAGITSMALGALLAVPEPRPEPVQKAIDAGLDWLVSLQHEDGSIHQGQLANYVTSASVLALVAARRPADAPRIAKARDFLKGLQADEGEGYSPGDRYYGGVGYGGDERPDLSNLQMALEALNAAGVPGSDPAFQKALVFLQRCQNRSESNDLALAVEGKTIASGNDGGAAYAPGESKAGLIELPDGKRVPRSYGSMSYALLKGYLFAGLSKDDPRVQAVWKWLRENYTLAVNPGFPPTDDPTASYQGLFYYFHTMARALDLSGDATVVDAQGVAHDWRAELAGRLVAMQRPDGSWINENAERWLEGNPVLATSYAMLSLGVARGK